MENFGKSDAERLAGIRHALAVQDLQAYPEFSRWMLAIRHHDTDTALRMAREVADAGHTADPALWYVALTGVRRLAGCDAMGMLLRNPPPLTSLPERWRGWAHTLEQLWGYARAHPLSLRNGTSLTLHTAGTLAVVRAKVNGVEGVLVFDTGAACTLLNESYARLSGVAFDTGSPARGLAAGGSLLPMYSGIAARLTIDEVTVEGAPILVANLPASMQVDGILSPLDLFRGFDVRVDLPRSECRIQRPGSEDSTLPFAAPLLWEEGNPLVGSVIDQRHAAHLLVDTGAGAHLLCRTFAESVLHWTTRAAGHSTTAGDLVAVHQGGKSIFRVASDPEDCSVTLAQECAPDPEALLPSLLRGYLGLPWFRTRDVVFAASRKRISWSCL